MTTPIPHDLFVGMTTTRIFALERTTGEPRWEVPLPKRKHGDLHIGAGRVFAVQHNTCFCIDYGSGQVVGVAELPFGAITRRCRILEDSGQFFISNSFQVVCLDANGRIQWTQEVAGLTDMLGTFGFPENVCPVDLTD